jgi:hypothetical protein
MEKPRNKKANIVTQMIVVLDRIVRSNDALTGAAAIRHSPQYKGAANAGVEPLGRVL